MLKRFSASKFWMVLAAVSGCLVSRSFRVFGAGQLVCGHAIVGCRRRRLAGEQRHLGHRFQLVGRASDQAWTSGNTGSFRRYGRHCDAQRLAKCGRTHLQFHRRLHAHRRHAQPGPLAAPAISVTTSTVNAISSILSGTGAVTIQAGTGTVVFSGSNTYSGGTVVDSGVLTLTSTNGSNLGTAHRRRRHHPQRRGACNSPRLPPTIPRRSATIAASRSALPAGTINVSRSLQRRLCHRRNVPCSTEASSAARAT